LSRHLLVFILAIPIPASGAPLSRLLVTLAALATLTVPAAAATLEEMAGQMIVVGFQGKSASAESVKAVADDIAQGHIGGGMFL